MSHELLLYALLPDLIVVAGIFLALGLDYTWLRGRAAADRNRIIARVATWSLLLSLGSITMNHAGITVGDGQLVYTETSITLKTLVFVLAAVVVELCARVTICRHVSEFYALLLFSTLGMGLVITSANLLSAFVALELTSLSLYAMTALWLHRRASAEAALKYLTFGGVSAAFLLFGLSHLYGATGHLDTEGITREITRLVLHDRTVPPLVVLGYVFVLIGLGFKLALAPFHFWVPDVYQNAPTPAAAWISAGSKIASVALLITLLQPAFAYRDDAVVRQALKDQQASAVIDREQKIRQALADLHEQRGVEPTNIQLVQQAVSELSQINPNLTDDEKMREAQNVVAGYLLPGVELADVQAHRDLWRYHPPEPDRQRLQKAREVLAYLPQLLGYGLAALAVLSMLWGNLAALRQTNLKRLLAYSAVANAGYLLVGLVAFDDHARVAVLFYAFVYALASLGAFGVISLLTDHLGRDAQIDDFRGCWKSMPVLSGLFLIFVLSMASIPPLAGFVGKFYLFYAAIGSQPSVAGWAEGWYWLVGLALFMSVVALYYYLKILKPFLVFAPDENTPAPLEDAGAATAALVVLALAIIAMGLYPQPLFDIFGATN